jgi:hypothetical protein
MIYYNTFLMLLVHWVTSVIGFIVLLELLSCIVSRY